MSFTLEDALASLRVVALPMKTKFRGIEVRETALFEGPAGWAEFAPFIEYDARESLAWLESAIEAATIHVPAGKRTSIPVNATVPASNDVSEIEEILSWYPGVDTVKIKVGTGIREDLARISRVRKVLPTAKIRVDVNGSWSVDDAIFNIRTIYGEVAGNFLEYVEQPVASLNELRELKERLIVDVKIAGDEVLRKAEDPFAINLDGAIDVLMLKVSPLGGIKRSLELAAHHKLPVVVSSALESVVGISYGLKLAAQLPVLNYACGLATSALMKADVGVIPIENGAMSVSTPEISREMLEKLTVSQERLEWWRNRITEVWRLRGAK
ncbi:MAG: O-succinylbenzoate synthase [Candidatus Nanopelagicaceae bacterium]|nr:O-succinylbenzoate synthase [Candidatus Nanopelagicaceae bacterium]